MELNTKNFLRKLELIKAGTATKGDEQSKSFLFSDEVLYSYSERMFASIPVKGLLFECQVNAKVLYDFIKKVKSKTIDIDFDGSVLKIKSEKSITKIKSSESVTIPSNLVDTGDINPLSENFSENILNASFSVGFEVSKPFLSCLQIKGNKISSTNNRSITIIETELYIKDEFYIPSYAIKHVSNMNPTHYSINQGWLSFIDPLSDVTLSCRTVDASKFPPLEQIFSRPMEMDEVVFPEDMNDSIDKAIIFAKHSAKNEQTVRIKSDGKDLFVGARSPIGEYKDKMAFEGVEFTFMTNAKALSDLLKRKPQVALNGKIMKLVNGVETHLISLGA